MKKAIFFFRDNFLCTETTVPKLAVSGQNSKATEKCPKAQMSSNWLGENEIHFCCSFVLLLLLLATVISEDSKV